MALLDGGNSLGKSPETVQAQVRNVQAGPANAGRAWNAQVR